MFKTESWQVEPLKTALSPFEAYQRLNGKNSVFLDSPGVSSKISRYSIIACYPETVFKVKNYQIEVTDENRIETLTGNPFDILKDLYYQKKEQFQFDIRNSKFEIPYVAGPIGYFSYDCNKYIEKLTDKANDDLKTPDMYFIFPKAALIFDKLTGKSYLSTSGEEIRDKVTADLRKPRPLGSFQTNSLSTNMTKKYFKDSVNKVKDYIYSGDVYQVNFSQRFETGFKGDSLALYSHLCNINPSPFSAYLELDDSTIISSSPERLIHLSGKNVQTRPIAGTRRRGKTGGEDDYLKGHLLIDDKEKAEHIMLVDLERNDLGRVCSYKSVHVDELYTIEKYSHVIHIVSNVKGKLRQDNDFFDLIKAVFPGGTITGCPKVRCMEIIEELEPTKRGPYTGSIGYIDYNGKADFNIIIRTFVLKKDRLYFQAGAGIVADSIDEREYCETVSKANALFQSLDISPKEVEWERMSS